VFRINNLLPLVVVAVDGLLSQHVCRSGQLCVLVVNSGVCY
jgi:hypothetical protein